MRQVTLAVASTISSGTRCAACLLFATGAALSSDPDPGKGLWADELAKFVAENPTASQPFSIDLDPRSIEPSLKSFSVCPAAWVEQEPELHSADLVMSYYQWILSRGYWVRIFRLPTSPNTACGVLYEPERKALSPSELALIWTAGSVGLNVTLDRFDCQRAADNERPFEPNKQEPAMTPPPPDLGTADDEKAETARMTGCFEKSYFPEGSGEEQPPPIIEAEEDLN